MTDHDLVIRGGTVIDGTGAEPRTADVAITDGVITEVGRGRRHAPARTIDADGLLVTPGLRRHPRPLRRPGLLGRAHDPVVVARRHHRRRRQLRRRLRPRPPRRPRPPHRADGGRRGHPRRRPRTRAWRGTGESFPEFLDAVDGRPFDVDVALQVPHGALRLHVMGERGAAREPATADDIAAMARSGGRGGRGRGARLHHLAHAQPPHQPGRAHADAHGRGRRAGRHRQRDRRHRAAACCRWCPTSPTSTPSSRSSAAWPRSRAGRCRSRCVQSPGRRPGGASSSCSTQANADGVPMTAQVAPRAVGLLLGLQCTLHPFLTNPVYREIAEPAARRAGGDAVATRRSGSGCCAAADGRADRARCGGRLLDGFDRMYELGDPPDYEPDPATSIARRAEREGRDPLDLAYDLLLADGGRAFLYLPLLNYADGNLDAAGEMLAHPHTVLGLADGGAHVGTICDASFPTTLLTLWGRDRDQGRLALPYLVHQHTQDTARTVGLLDRGVLAPGYRADVNVIDFDRLDGAPPGDAPRPARRRPAPGPAGRRLRRHRRRRPGHLRARRADRPAARPPRPRPATRTRRRTRAPMTHHRRLGRRVRSSRTASGAATSSATATSSTSPTTHVAELDAALVARRGARRRRARHHPRAVPAAHARPGARRRITDELINGRGVVLIRGVPVDALQQGPGLGDLLGRRHAPRAALAAERQGPPARRRHRPGPRRRRPTRPGQRDRRRRRSRSTPTAPTSSACSASTPAPSGGASLVANAVTIHNDLVARCTRAGRRALRAVPLRPAGRAGPGSEELVHDADLQPARADRLFVRYIRPYIDVVPAPRGRAPAVGDRRRAAMDRLDAMCADPQYHVSMGLRAGRHAVREQLPRAARPRRRTSTTGPPGKIRHLKRLWLETDLLADDDKPERFRLGRTDSYWSSKGRTKSELDI